MRALLGVILPLSAIAMCVGASACASRAKCAPTQDSQAGAAQAQAQAAGAPSCEEAIRTAAKTVPEIAARNDLAEAVAACIKDEWSAESRRCVATARDQPDLVACMMRHEQQQEAAARTAEGREPDTDRRGAAAPGAGAAPKHLSVTSVEPDRGDINGDTYVLIKGSRFVADGPRMAKVYFGSRQGAVVRFASDRELIVRTPAGKPGETVDVRVVFEPGGELVLPAAFTYVEKQPYAPPP